MAKKKILVVDDEPNIVKLLESILKDEGYEVVIAFDGEEALNKVKETTPDLIILDITLPKVDGYGVCNILQADEKYKDIPIVFLTARGQVMDIKTGMELGAVSYISKPFNVKVLLGIIKGAVG